MNSKRSRSVNWDEEEKLLFRSVLKNYAHIIEDKTLNTNTNKNKTKAWEEVFKKFNVLNCRQRELKQLKLQWKSMKVNARKNCSKFKNEMMKTGGEARPATPNDSNIEVIDLLNDGLVPEGKLTFKNLSDSGSKKMNIDYVSAMISHSKNLKDEEHRRRMEMAEEEHTIKLNIQQEKLKCANLEREILELRKNYVKKLTDL